MSTQNKQVAEPKDSEKEQQEKPVCGIIMPISAMDGEHYTEKHWKTVKAVIEDAIVGANFTCQPVWESDSTSIIQARIVNNLQNMPIIVCDISGKNANVMLELGIRISYEKPVILIKDTHTQIPFDTSPQTYIEYDVKVDYTTGRDLKTKLKESIETTYDQVKQGKYKPFMKYFADVDPASTKNIDAKEAIELLRQEMEELRAYVHSLSNQDSTLTQIEFNNICGEMRNIIRKIKNSIKHHNVIRPELVDYYEKLKGNLFRYVTVKCQVVPESLISEMSALDSCMKELNEINDWNFSTNACFSF